MQYFSDALTHVCSWLRVHLLKITPVLRHISQASHTDASDGRCEQFPSA
jgi:hypothetical protein